MLVLSRKKNESILIFKDGDPNPEKMLEICVVECGGGKVRLGINAPKTDVILRKELSTEHAPKKA